MLEGTCLLYMLGDGGDRIPAGGGASLGGGGGE